MLNIVLVKFTHTPKPSNNACTIKVMNAILKGQKQETAGKLWEMTYLFEKIKSEVTSNT